MFFRGLCLVAAILFVFSAALQYNDPDPVQWMAIYLAAAAVSAAVALRSRRPPWFVPTVVGVAALVWALTIAPHALGRIPLSRMFQAWEMKNTVVEENRETIGLLIVVFWMAVIVLEGLLRRPRPRPT